MSLKGKSIYITGGTGGIGAPLVDLLRKAEAHVTLYNRDIDGDLIKKVDEIASRLKENTPDILINMAGVNVIDFCENQDLDTIIGLNMIVPMKLTQAVLPEMKRKNQGQIVTVGSMTSLIPLPHYTGYVAAKAGLKAFNDALRRELGGTNISLTFVMPRAVETQMNSGVKGAVNERTKTNYDSSSYVAKRIFDAIRNKEQEVRFGMPERFFAFLNANLPSLVDQGLQKNRVIGEEELRKANQ